MYNGDEYYDLQNSGLLDNKGKQISHKEQYEFMLGYNDDSHSSRKSSQDDLDTILLASLSCSLASLCASTSI